MRIYKILKKTNAEGPGNRFCIWVQGCSKHCKGCFAKETWNFSAGTEYSAEELFAMINSQENIEGVTFLGGEPFEQASEVLKLTKLIKAKNLSVVCFTGFKIEDLKSQNNNIINELLDNIDLLIDGEFQQDKFDLSRPWIGSSNQRYIFLSNRYKLRDIMKYRNRVEIRISEDGRLVMNGMGNFETLKSDICLQDYKNIVK